MKPEGKNQWAFSDHRGVVWIRIRVDAEGRLHFIPDDDAYAVDLTVEESKEVARAILGPSQSRSEPG